MMNENGYTKMMEPEETLQQRLEQLAAGRPLEACLDGLTEQEARMVRLAAALQDAPQPEADEAITAVQRQRVLQAAAQTLPAAPVSESAPVQTAVPLLQSVRAGIDWLFSRRELAVGLAAALVVVVLLAVGIGLTRRDGPMQVEEDGRPATGAVAETDNATPQTEEETVTVEETAVPAAEGAPSDTPAQQLFLPFTSSAVAIDAQTAVAQVINGVLEVQAGDQTWTAVARAAPLAAGQRLRTGPLSSATLTFFDGSQAFLGPETELSVDELNAQRPEDGFRTVVLTQWLGESEHEVAFRNDGGSRYEVRTPGGSGVARGTRFRVSVAANLLARFSVSEGRVDVSSANSTVSVIAGQLTTSTAGRAPDAPAFHISGEGEVSQTGSAWTIAGQTFQMHDGTVIVGNPQVGDVVRVDGRLQADDMRLADVIVLLRRAASNRFQLSGPVEAIGAAAWIVAGQTVIVDDDTRIDDGIVVGDGVQVDGVLRPDGSLLARRVQQTGSARPFHFTGVVQEIGADMWRISGQQVRVDDDTAVAGGLAVGDEVAVNGRITGDDEWLATRIQRATEPERRFAFTGRVQSVSPWLVGGVVFEMQAWTIVAPGIDVGSRVRVQGVVLPDGTWAAERIDLLRSDDDDDGRVLIIVGIVNSLNPLVINGISFDFDDIGNGNSNSAWLGDSVQINTLVQVQVRLQANGRWVVTSVRTLNNSFGLGCLNVSSVVVSVNASQIGLRHWSDVSLASVNVAGSVQVNSVVTVVVCTGFNNVVVVTNVVVISNSLVFTPPPAGRPRGNWNGNWNGNFNG